jgi:uncharacterized protein (DUF1800 family)
LLAVQGPDAINRRNKVMTLDPRGAALALHRFGFGPRPGTIAAIASDPRGALLAELDKPNAGKIPDAGLMSGGAASRMASDFIAERAARQKLETKRLEAAKAARQEAARLAADNPTMQNSASDSAGMEKSADVKGAEEKVTEAKAMPPQQETPMIENFFREAKAHYDGAVRAEIGFAERLVWFWSNHFCINSDITVQAGAYEREAIRPHVLGKFVDLLIAAESHSAMLNYLGNSASMGPNSVAGINRDRGLNENLGREILELHTLGVRTGYTQDDVVSFAKVITGWTTYGDVPERGGEFLFYPRFHEPGPQTVLGKAYRDSGFEQGKEVLADLARHPATALHVATKLARHFIADEPPATLVETLRQKFVETDGDLWQVARALAMAPESWAPEQTKLKRPSEWMMSYIRGGGFNGVDVRRAAPSLTRLGEPLWRPPAPKGFPDDEAAWIDSIAHRLETANAYAQNPNIEDRLDPKAMLEASLGPLASPETRNAVNRAENKQQAIVLLLMAPEFQRR